MKFRFFNPKPLPLLLLFLVIGFDWPAYRINNQRSSATPARLKMPLVESWSQQSPHPPTPAWPLPAKSSYWQRLSQITPRVVDDHAYHLVSDGKRVFYGSSTDDQIHALDIITGEEVWTFFAGGPIRYAPALSEGRLYFGSDDGFIYCLKDEQLVWKHHVAERNRILPGNGRMISAWPVRTGLIVDEGTVYATAGLFPGQDVLACALRASDGSVRWKRKIGLSAQGYLLSTKSRLYIPTGRGNPVAVDKTSGDLVMQFDGVGGSFAVLADETLLSGRGNNDDLTVSDLTTRDVLVTFKGKHAVVTPEVSYLLNESSLRALDRAHYVRLSREINTLNSQLAVHRKRQEPERMAELSGRIDQLRLEQQKCLLWDHEPSGTESLALVGDQLILGGDGKVFAHDAKTGQQVWSGSVQGRALSLAAADGRLFVSTDQGFIHCFGTQAGKPPRTTYPPAEIPSKARNEAAAILAQASKQGFALVFGDADLACAIAEKSDLGVIVVGPESLRPLVAARKLYGRPVSVLAVEGDKLPFTDYFANLVVGGQEWGAETDRVLRPDGGLRWGEVPRVREPLPGAGSWSTLYGSPGNSSNSGDACTSQDLELQWFGGPGPRPMVDRHLRSHAPLAVGGRLFIPGENKLIAVDAYNGTELWERDLPASHRYSIPYDAGYITADRKHVYAAVRDAAWVINAGTGRVESTIALPDAGKLWGWLVEHRGSLYASAMKPGAPRLTPSRQQVDDDYKSAQALVTSTAVHRFDEGSLIWSYAAGAILNPTLAIEGDNVFFVESRNAASVGHPTGRIPLSTLLSSEAYLVCLGAEDGKVKWQTPLELPDVSNILYLASAGDRLVTVGSGVSENDSQYYVNVFSVADGQPLWKARHAKGAPAALGHGEQLHHPVVLGDILVAEPMMYELKTGKPFHPDAGGEPWNLKRPGHSCGTMSGGGNCVFFRANTPTLFDISPGLSPAKRTRRVTQVNRPGCWINIIPAQGLVLIPEASSGCVCNYSLQTSMAFRPVSGEARPRTSPQSSNLKSQNIPGLRGQ